MLLLQDPIRYYVPKKDDDFDSRMHVMTLSSTGLSSSNVDAELQVLHSLVNVSRFSAKSPTLSLSSY